MEIHVCELTKRRLEHAQKELLPWRTIEDLAAAAVEEAALEYAKRNGGPMQ